MRVPQYELRFLWQAPSPLWHPLSFINGARKWMDYDSGFGGAGELVGGGELIRKVGYVSAASLYW
jgi:hypothetical protein